MFVKVLKDFGISDKILLITCDNMTNNNRMIDKLAGQLAEFPGAPNCAHCFMHILNLVVKSILNQFDAPRMWRKLDPKTDERSLTELDLASDIEAEELEMQAEQEDSQEGPEEDPYNDNNEDWFNERDGMVQEEIDELEERVQPIRVLLTKVGKLVSRSCIVLPNQSTRLRFANLHTKSGTQV